QERGEVDDATRRDLYLLADALLFTSEREGFGIPILEAGLARLPIFCADIPPFHESAREHAHYFSLDEAPTTIAARIAAELSRDARYRMKQRVLHEYAWEQIFTERIEPLVNALGRT
ncbi:MAG: glycosyltransferase, partial [Chloroflexota bacterium]